MTMLLTYSTYYNNSIKQSKALRLMKKVTFMPISSQNPQIGGCSEQFNPTSVVFQP